MEQAWSQRIVTPEIFTCRIGRVSAWGDLTSWREYLHQFGIVYASATAPSGQENGGRSVKVVERPLLGEQITRSSLLLVHAAAL
jgi:hypothetical protein